MVIKDLVSSTPVCLNSSCTVAEALEFVLERNVAEVYITDDEGRLAGVVTDYELLKSQLMNTVDDRGVETVMCRCPAVASAVEPVAAVAARFRDGRHSKLAVVEDGKLVGTVGRHDVMRSVQADAVLSAVSESVAVESPAAEATRKPRYLQPAATVLDRLAAAPV
ncbi:MAG: cyclic nucleotide-binding/CBS domain-containing protein [Planctomycetaceae bacterium]